MKKAIKRAACVALSVLMIGGAFAGCSTQDDSNDGNKVYKVGVCQLVQHAALDKATEGFQAAIKEKLGDKVEVDVQNASGDTANCTTIANKFVSSNYDLIMAVATPALQACTTATAASQTPIVATAVTHFGTALDTAFHSTMPPKAYMYALPYEYYEKYSVRRYGFHGTSHKFVSHRAADRIGKNIKDLKIITCHLGNGSSIAAVDHGKVVDTSMGFTPLDGFMMGTRSGGVDPSAVTFIMKNENLTPDEMDAILNKQSGVQAISGISSDDRDICKAQEKGDERAILAHEMQAYEIAKFIGSYVAAMNGVDAIVFTGGIGENGVWLRSKVCSYLGYLGVHINEAVNSKTQKGAEAELTEPTDNVRVFILATDEELMIARDTEELVKSL